MKPRAGLQRDDEILGAFCDPIRDGCHDERRHSTACGNHDHARNRRDIGRRRLADRGIQREPHGERRTHVATARNGERHRRTAGFEHAERGGFNLHAHRLRTTEDQHAAAVRVERRHATRRERDIRIRTVRGERCRVGREGRQPRDEMLCDCDRHTIVERGEHRGRIALEEKCARANDRAIVGRAAGGLHELRSLRADGAGLGALHDLEETRLGRRAGRLDHHAGLHVFTVGRLAGADVHRLRHRAEREQRRDEEFCLGGRAFASHRGGHVPRDGRRLGEVEIKPFEQTGRRRLRAVIDDHVVGFHPDETAAGMRDRADFGAAARVVEIRRITVEVHEARAHRAGDDRGIAHRIVRELAAVIDLELRVGLAAVLVDERRGILDRRRVAIIGATLKQAVTGHDLREPETVFPEAETE